MKTILHLAAAVTGCLVTLAAAPAAIPPEAWPQRHVSLVVPYTAARALSTSTGAHLSVFAPESNS